MEKKVSQKTQFGNVAQELLEQGPREGKERIFRKTVEIIEKPVAVVAETQTTFTTEPKKWPRRRRKLETVRERCEDLIQLQWPLKEVGYMKLKMDMITKLGLCDRTTHTAYLGRSAQKHIRRVSQEVRYLRNNTIVQKEHTFKETVPSRIGFLEIFGLVTMFQKEGKAWFKIHYENSWRKYHYDERLEPHIHQECEGVESLPRKTSLSPIMVPEGVVQECCGEAEESTGERRERDSLNVRERKSVYKRKDFAGYRDSDVAFQSLLKHAEPRNHRGHIKVRRCSNG